MSNKGADHTARMRRLHDLHLCCSHICDISRFSHDMAHVYKRTNMIFYTLTFAGP